MIVYHPAQHSSRRLEYTLVVAGLASATWVQVRLGAVIPKEPQQV